MQEKGYHIRGRRIDEAELKTIKRFVKTYWDQGRSAISRALCTHWEWRQPNGYLKDRACRVLLLVLEEKGEIALPARILYNNRYKKIPEGSCYQISRDEITGKVSDFGSLTIHRVWHSPEEGLWNYLIHEHHYLGYPWIVGSHLKYLAYLDEHLVGCLGWGSAAWKVACRDRFIGWDHDRRQSNLYKVVNNVRFLILPWVRVEHLASKLLALNIRQLPKDWQHIYQHPISLLETFVDTSRFKGTCYKAGNWIYAGITKGRGKYDRYNRAVKPPKAVYLYPLKRNFREALNAG